MARKKQAGGGTPATLVLTSAGQLDLKALARALGGSRAAMAEVGAASTWK